MNGASHLLSRDGTYYFQRRVPDHIKAFFKAHPESPSGLPQEITDYFARKPSVRLSLRTKIKKDAVRLCTEADFKFNSYVTKFDQWQQSGASTFDVVTTETLKGLAQTWLARAIEDDENLRLSGLSDEEVEATESGWWYFESEFREALVTGRETEATPMMDKVAANLLAEFQIMLDRDGLQFATLINHRPNH